MKRLIVFILAFWLSDPICAPAQNGPNKLYPILFNHVRDLYPEYEGIPFERRVVLDEIANYTLGTIQFDGNAEILLIGSNNATRSILAEAWANAAAYYYGIDNVKISSGGVTKKEISRYAIMALEKAGFIIYRKQQIGVEQYEVKYTYHIDPLVISSKLYNDKDNPDLNFGSVILCPNADINLPVVKGNNFRTSLHYFDPIAYENDPDVLDKYLDKSHEIALEMFYLFYKLKGIKSN